MVTVREVRSGDKAAWNGLYRQYVDYYGHEYGQSKVDTLWGWIESGDIHCRVAEAEGKLIGLIHFRSMPSPLRGELIGFADDVFVEPACRGQQVADKLFEAVRDFAAAEGWPFVRWITKKNNYRGKGFYDKIASLTDWDTYQMEA